MSGWLLSARDLMESGRKGRGLSSLTSSHPRTAVSFFCVILLKVAGAKAQEGALHVLTERVPTHRQHELTLIHICRARGQRGEASAPWPWLRPMTRSQSPGSPGK